MSTMITIDELIKHAETYTATGAVEDLRAAIFSGDSDYYEDAQMLLGIVFLIAEILPASNGADWRNNLNAILNQIESRAE